jgi:hypothetical protein
VAAVISNLRSNSIGSCKFLLLIDINFREGDFVWSRKLSGQLLVYWGNLLARTTPCRMDCSRQRFVVDEAGGVYLQSATTILEVATIELNCAVDCMTTVLDIFATKNFML